MSKAEYDQKYIKDNIVRKLLPFNKTKPDDVEILEWLSSQPNMTSYIKNLIRNDMESQKSAKNPDLEPKNGVF